MMVLVGVGGEWHQNEPHVPGNSLMGLGPRENAIIIVGGDPLIWLNRWEIFYTRPHILLCK